jgi:ABC-type Fe3+ transport system permease subunit
MFLDYFALAVLLILGVAAAVIWVLLGIMPGRIARDRNHPQADAISVCGWWGVLTMGLLLPLAYIWAYSNPSPRDESRSDRNETKEDGTA